MERLDQPRAGEPARRDQLWMVAKQAQSASRQPQQGRCRPGHWPVSAGAYSGARCAGSQSLDELAGATPRLVLLSDSATRRPFDALGGRPPSHPPRRRESPLDRNDLPRHKVRRGGWARLACPASGEGRRVLGGAAGRLWSLSGFDIRAEPHWHAAGLTQAEAGLPAPSGPDEPQHQRRLVDVDLHGRAELPDRTPPVPLDGPPTLTPGAAADQGVLRCRRCAVHPNDPVAGIPLGDQLPQHGWAARQGFLRVPARRAATGPVVPCGARRAGGAGQRVRARPLDWAALCVRVALVALCFPEAVRRSGDRLGRSKPGWVLWRRRFERGRPMLGLAGTAARTGGIRTRSPGASSRRMGSAAFSTRVVMGLIPAARVSARTSPSCAAVVRMITVPALPARPVRPERWTFAFCSTGGSACTTIAMSSTWIPRAAMSVATRVCARPAWKAARLRVRAFWLRSPCSSTAGMPCALSWLVSALARCLVRVKTSAWPGALVSSARTGNRCSCSMCS